MSKSLKIANLVQDCIQLSTKPGKSVLVYSSMKIEVKSLIKVLVSYGFEAVTVRTTSEVQQVFAANPLARGLVILGDRARSELSALREKCPELSEIGTLVIGDEQVQLTADGKLVTVQDVEIINPPPSSAIAEEAA